MCSPGKTKTEPNFVINQNPEIRREIGAIVRSRESDTNKLLGETRVILSEKGHRSTAGLLFSKASFSAVPKIRNNNQRCGAKGCKCCNIMNIDIHALNKIGSITGQKIKPDNSLTCKSSNVIYIFLFVNFVSANPLFQTIILGEQWINYT